MSKKVKSLIEKETANRLTGVEAVAVLNPRGIGAIANNQIRRRLREQNLRMTVVKNTMAARATANSKLKGFESLLSGPSALVYGQGVAISVIARALLAEKKLLEDNKGTLELRGAFFDGEIYEGDKGVEKASVDTYLGAKVGSKVTVKYTDKAGEKTAVGVKDAGKATGKALAD